MIIRSLRKIRTSLDKKYSHLLLALLLNFIAANFIVGVFTKILLSLFFLYTIVVIVETVYSKRTLFRFYNLIIFVAFILQIITDLQVVDSASFLFSIFSSIVHIIYLAIGTYSIFKDILYADEVTIDNIIGSVCIYFLTGFLWALMYNLCLTFNGEAFSQPLSDNAFRTLLYFSFTTLTTLGYGDIYPVSNMARMLTNLQGIIGQMYPAILISILVSIYTSQKIK